MKCNTVACPDTHTDTQTESTEVLETKMFTKACKKFEKHEKKRNESISQPAENKRQTLLSSACNVGATWFIA